MMNNEQYLDKLKEITLYFNHLINLLDKLGLAEEAGKLRQDAAELDRDMFKVMVVGDFNSGKSTLLNALLGAPCLPAKATPSTAVITIIEYGNVPEITVNYHDGRPPQKMRVEDFQARYQLKTEDARAMDELSLLFGQVREAVLSYPVELCRHKVVLIDSPGLNESFLSSSITDEYLSRADLVLFIFNATKACSENEENYLKERVFPACRGRVFFVLNMWDLVGKMSIFETSREEEEILKRFREKLAPNLGDSFERCFFPVSAKMALEAKNGTADPARWNESGFPGLTKELEEYLFAQKGRTIVQRALQIAQAATGGRAVQAISVMRSLVVVDEVQWAKRAHEVEARLPALIKIRDQAKRILVESCKKTQQTVYVALLDFAEKLAVEFEEDAWFEPDEQFYNGLATGDMQQLRDEVSRKAMVYLETRLADFCRGNLRDLLSKGYQNASEYLQAYAEAFEMVAAEIMELCAGRTIGVPQAEPFFLPAPGSVSGFRDSFHDAVNGLTRQMVMLIGLPLLARLTYHMSGMELPDANDVATDPSLLTGIVSQSVSEQLVPTTTSLKTAVEDVLNSDFFKYTEKIGRAFGGRIADIYSVISRFSHYRRQCVVGKNEAMQKLFGIEQMLAEINKFFKTLS